MLDTDVVFWMFCHRVVIRRCGVRRPVDLLPSRLEARRVLQVLEDSLKSWAQCGKFSLSSIFSDPTLLDTQSGLQFNLRQVTRRDQTT